jgi:GDSL-like lipase/acylhydrolase family protein
MKPPRKRKALVANLLLLVGSVIAALILLETSLRLLAPEPKPSDAFMQAHPHYLFRLIPGSSGSWDVAQDDGSTKKVPFQISTQGLREDRVFGPKPSNGLRVVCLGDSYTMGAGLENLEDTYPRRLEKCLQEALPGRKIEVVNAGIMGWGVWQSLAFLHAELLALEPDLVVMQTYAGNDIRDSLVKVGKSLECDDGFWIALMQRYREEGRPAALLNKRLRKMSVVYARLGDLVAPWRPVEALEFNCGRRWSFEVILKDYYPALEEGWIITEIDLGGLGAVCRAANVPLIVFNAPGLYDVSEELFDEWRNDADPSLYDRHKDAERMAEAFQTFGYHSAPVREAFLADPDPKSLYIPHDGHWTARGSEVIAQVVCTEAVPFLQSTNTN